jgi:hypothetical protein
MSEPDANDSTDSSESTDEGGSILDDGGIDTDERAGRSQGIDVDSEPDDDTKHEMEEERDRRLDPENRPDGAEIDNTDRDFDVDKGMFTDNEAYDEVDPEYKDPEDPNSDASPDDAAEGADDEGGKDDDEGSDGSDEEKDS